MILKLRQCYMSVVPSSSTLMGIIIVIVLAILYDYDTRSCQEILHSPSPINHRVVKQGIYPVDLAGI